MRESLLSAVFDWLYPPQCIEPTCRQPGAWLCGECLARVCPVPWPTCARCALPLRGDQPSRRKMWVCPRCRADPPPFRHATAAGLYSGVLRRGIHALKFYRNLAVAPELAALAAAEVDRNVADNGVIVPVPSHRSRVAERGVDHTAVLANAIGRVLGLPVVADALVRVRRTRLQSGLGAADREVNLLGAISSSRPNVAKTVLLVDDVMTTGATARACAQVLLRSGASTIDVCLIARAPQQH